MCLALTKLLETNEPFILVNLQSLMTMWTNLVTELREDEDDTWGDSLVYKRDETDPASNGGQPEAPEDARKRESTYEDPVHRIHLPAFVKEQLGRAISASGGADRFQQEWVVNVDRDVLEAFSKLGIM